MTPKPLHLLHPKYRRDIDGLRAVAVLAVVAFHAFPNWVKGGFIGVDVFFVISGYLISTIIFESLDKGTFSFSEFYARRIKRIFPALIIVLVACFTFGWFALFPHEYKQLGEHIAAGAGFLSNIVLWKDAGYFDNAADTKPLLHLWSLGIEEQFYIVWPFLLWISWKRKFNLLIITILVATLSFILNIQGVKHNAVATFYSPLTRFWELLIGSLLAWITIHKKGAYQNVELKMEGWLGSIICLKKVEGDGKILSNVLSVLGLFLLALGFLRINKDLIFPGWCALVPVLAAVLIITASSKAWVNRIILSNKVAVWFGLISFPLYLWHWPLLSFARIVEGKAPIVNIRIAAVVLAIGLAWFTYELIECPMRSSKHGKVKVTVLTVLLFIVGCGGFYTDITNGLSFRNKLTIELFKQINDVKQPFGTRVSDGSCQTKLGLRVAEGTVCLTNSSAPEVLIVGDSHAMALNSSAYFGKSSLKTLLIGVHTCPPLVGYIVTDLGINIKGCDGTMIEQVNRTLAKYESIKTVVLASRGPHYFSHEEYGIEGKNTLLIKPLTNHIESQKIMFRNGLSNFISILQLKKKSIVLSIDVPELGEEPLGCILKRPFAITNRSISTCTQDKGKVLYRQATYRKLIDDIKLKHSSINVYDPLSVFCDDLTCYGLRYNKLYYWDKDHISISGSTAVLTDMVKKDLFR